VKLIGIICLFPAALLLAQTAPDPAATARHALDLLLAQKYADLNPLFTPEMQKAFPDASLTKLGAQIQSFGALGQIDAPSTQMAGANTVVLIPVHFASQNVNFRYIVNSRGVISGMFLLPGSVAWQHPPYAKPDSLHERQVTIGEDPWKLPGTLTLPNAGGRAAAVVLVHDVGQLDRDETIGGNKIFRDLAEGLATRGIAVLRYEKRTHQYAAQMAGLHGMTVDDETVDDAAAGAAFLRTQPEIDPRRVYVLGHGLGGYVAARIAAADGKLAGIIILAGNARPLEDVVVDQAESLNLPAKELAAVKAAAKRVKSLEESDLDSPELLGMSISYLLDLKGYDPVAATRKLAVPLLVLAGERDFQVPMKDFALWKAGLAGRKDTQLQSYPSLNHLFVAGEGKSSEAEYRKPGHVAPEVVDAIAKWVKP
jgi:dienelactone hydrolase